MLGMDTTEPSTGRIMAARRVKYGISQTRQHVPAALKRCHHRPS